MKLDLSGNNRHAEVVNLAAERNRRRPETPPPFCSACVSGARAFLRGEPEPISETKVLQVLEGFCRQSQDNFAECPASRY